MDLQDPASLKKEILSGDTFTQLVSKATILIEYRTLTTMQNQILYGIARANSTLSTPLNLHKSDTTAIPKAIADVFDTTEKLWTDREALKVQLEKLKAALAVAERKNAQKFSTPNDPDSAGQKPCTPLKDGPYVKAALLAVERIKSDRDSLRTDIEGLTIKLE